VRNIYEEFRYKKLIYIQKALTNTTIFNI